jgi:malate/lactate dehydrogenase
MTNADKIRKMSNWELAEFIYNVSNEATQITTCKKECKKCEYSEAYCIFKIGEWLISEQQTSGK